MCIRDRIQPDAVAVSLIDVPSMPEIFVSTAASGCAYDALVAPALDENVTAVARHARPTIRRGRFFMTT